MHTQATSQLILFTKACANIARHDMYCIACSESIVRVRLGKDGNGMSHIELFRIKGGAIKIGD